MEHVICGFPGWAPRPCKRVLGVSRARTHLRCAARSTERMRHPIEVALCELRGLSSGGQNVVLRLAEPMFDELVGQPLESIA